jgi:hypothetical protein
MDKLEEARDHLGAALLQAHRCDDQIILDHIMAAHDLLRQELANYRDWRWTDEAKHHNAVLMEGAR